MTVQQKLKEHGKSTIIKNVKNKKKLKIKFKRKIITQRPYPTKES